MKDKMKEKNNKSIDLTWEVKTSLKNNPLVWFQLFIVSIVGPGFVLLLLLSLNLFENRWENIPDSFLVGFILFFCFFIVMSLILFLISKGITTRYTVSKDLVVQETLSGYGRFARIIAFLGILSGQRQGVTAAGATLLAQSREVLAINWKDISNVEEYNNRFEIRLKNQWRTVMQIICLPDNYQNILNEVHKIIKTQKPPKEEASGFSKIILTLLALLMGMFLLPKLPINFPGAFTIPMIILAFPVIWSTKKLQKFSAVTIFVLQIVGISLAFYFKEVDFTKEGTKYAMAIQIIAFIFYLYICARVFFSRVKTKNTEKKEK